MRDLGICNELHINNFIILPSAEDKGRTGKEKATSSPCKAQQRIPLRQITKVAGRPYSPFNLKIGSESQRQDPKYGLASYMAETDRTNEGGQVPLKYCPLWRG